MRKFEKVSFEQFKKDFEGWISESEMQEIYDNIKLPKRGTKHSAGYDFFCPVSFYISPNKTAKIPTGIKAHMNEGEVLKIYVRSSMGFKHGINLLNSVGIIDFDYVNNPSNEGHIWMGFKNTSENDWFVYCGDAFGQGIFAPFLITDDDSAEDERIGGIGSTSK
jgi:dUTP pyrophosphatase